MKRRDGSVDAIDWYASAPPHWERKPLKYLTQHIGSGKTPSGGGEAYTDSGVTFLRSQNVYDEGLRLDDVVFIPPEIDEEMSGSRVRSGDLLLNITGASIGRSCLAPHTLGAANVNQHVCIVRPSEPQHAPWLAALFTSSALQSQIDLAQNGAGREGLNFEQIANMEVVLPPVPEQQAFIRFLDRETTRIDALIEKKTRFIELLREKRQALITQAVTQGLDPAVPMKDSGVEWLGQVPAHWGVAQIRHVARLGSGHTPSREVPDYWIDCDIPWITLADVWQIRKEGREVITDTEEKISALGVANSSAVVHPAGSVLLSRTASVGFAAIMGRDMATSQDFAVWTCGPLVHNEYLYYVLLGMEQEFVRVRMGSTHKTIYMPDIEAFKMPLPPIAEQRNIASRLARGLKQNEALVSITLRSIDLLKERRSALITAAVTGQIDLREAA